MNKILTGLLGLLLIAPAFAADAPAPTAPSYDAAMAQRLVATDPVIISGEMVAEYHHWYASAAVMLLPDLHKKLQPPE